MGSGMEGYDLLSLV